MGVFDSWNIEDFKVVLACGAVSPGDPVSGNLIFKVTKPMSFRRVSIKIIGVERTHITVVTNHGKTRTTPHFYARNNVHKEFITLLGGGKGSTFKGELPPGDYNFPFAFILPPNAPPTVPMFSGDRCEGKLHWYVKAEVDIPFSFSDSNTIAHFYVRGAMPAVQYLSRQPFQSSIHNAGRLCCLCCDQGVTKVQMNLASNLLIFGRDKNLQGEISVNNEQSKQGTDVIHVRLRRVCWMKAEGYERTPLVEIASTHIRCGMKPGDPEKRFTFSINLPHSAPELVSCYRGHAIFFYYQLVAVCDGDELFKINLIGSGALDEKNHHPPLAVDHPSSVLVPHGHYPSFVYAPPPGANAVFPTQPADHIPQATGKVRPYSYAKPHFDVRHSPHSTGQDHQPFGA